MVPDQSISATDRHQLPLPPYPDSIGHPLTHPFRTMPDVLGFRDTAMASDDVIRTYFFGTGDIYNLGHPSDFKRVLVDEQNSFSKSADFAIAFGDGLVAAEGSLWQRQRQLLQPLFTKDCINSYISTMTEQVSRRVASWENNESLDLQDEMQRLTLDVLFATLFGRELELGGDAEIREAAGRLHDWFTPTSYPLPTWLPTPSRHRFKNGRAKLRSIAAELIESKATGSESGIDQDADLLSLLVNRRDAGDESILSNAQLQDQVITLIFAGHETTASALALSLYEIAHHDEIRKRFHSEIDALSTPVTRSDLDNLTVTERIIKETLRMYPPVYIIPRITDQELAIDGYRVPSDVPVWLAVRQVHRDSRFYENPDQFQPSRWDTDIQSSNPDFAYAPFGGGPRLCIGRQFALVETKLALAIIGRRYTLQDRKKSHRNGGTTGSNPPLTADMTLRLTPGTEFYTSKR